LNSVVKFGRLYAPPAARDLNVLSTLVSTIIWWVPNYPRLNLSSRTAPARRLLKNSFSNTFNRVVFHGVDSFIRFPQSSIYEDEGMSAIDPNKDSAHQPDTGG
jgi:hypothetical protein